MRPVYKLTKQSLSRPITIDDISRINQLKATIVSLRSLGIKNTEGIREGIQGVREAIKPRTRYTYILTRSDLPGMEAKGEYGPAYSLCELFSDLKSEFKRQLKRIRSARKANIEVSKSIFGQRVKLVGGTYTTPGIILRILKETRSTRVYQDKKPKSDDRHIGVEIEFFCEHTQADVIETIYKHALQSLVTLKSDGSIRPDKACECTDDNGDPLDTCDCGRQIAHELCVLTTELEYQSVIRRVTNMLRELGADVNDSCGLHVHLDIRHRRSGKAFRNLVLAQGMLYGMQPKSRRSNRFCAPTTFTKLNKRADRYRGINGASVPKHKTVEVRIHSGTCHADKIINWIELLISIVNAKAFEKPIHAVTDLPYDISSALKVYIEGRTAKFGAIDIAQFSYRDAA